MIAYCPNSASALSTRASIDLDRAWAECGRWAEKLAQFEHPKIQAVRLAANPNTPLLPQDMTIEELRDSILADLERLRESGVLDLPVLAKGVVES